MVCTFLYSAENVDPFNLEDPFKQDPFKTVSFADDPFAGDPFHVSPYVLSFSSYVYVCHFIHVYCCAVLI